MKPKSSSPDAAYEIRVSGRVQGVGFRYSTAARAHELALTGWVRNERDGSVFILCEGPEDRCRALSSWLNVGPPGAHVRDVRVRAVPFTGSYARFSIEY